MYINNYNAYAPLFENKHPLKLNTYDNILDCPNIEESAYKSDKLLWFTKTLELAQYLNLNLMNRNLKTLKYRKYNKIELIFNDKKKLSGEYNVVTNKLKYKNRNSLIHELIHAASSYFKDGVRYCGFSQKRDLCFSIGVGLNEGYTSLLAKRYFNTESNEYEDLNHIVFLIEDIVGQESMEKSYFNANLKGLINELTKYITLEEIVKLVTNMDKLHSLYLQSINPSKKIDLEIEKNYQNTLDILEKAKNNKVYKKELV